MRRFAQNRWLAFILTLSVLIASHTIVAVSVAGPGPEPLVIGGGEGGSTPAGDPDAPSGPGKRTPAGSRVSPGGYGYAMTSVGDGGPAYRVWVWRFQSVLRGLMSRYDRF